MLITAIAAFASAITTFDGVMVVFSEKIAEHWVPPLLIAIFVIGATSLMLFYFWTYVWKKYKPFDDNAPMTTKNVLMMIPFLILIFGFSTNFSIISLGAEASTNQNMEKVLSEIRVIQRQLYKDQLGVLQRMETYLYDKKNQMEQATQEELEDSSEYQGMGPLWRSKRLLKERINSLLKTITRDKRGIENDKDSNNGMRVLNNKLYKLYISKGKSSSTPDGLSLKELRNQFNSQLTGLITRLNSLAVVSSIDVIDGFLTEIEVEIDKMQSLKQEFEHKEGNYREYIQRINDHVDLLLSIKNKFRNDYLESLPDADKLQKRISNIKLVSLNYVIYKYPSIGSIGLAVILDHFMFYIILLGFASKRESLFAPLPER